MSAGGSQALGFLSPLSGLRVSDAQESQFVLLSQVDLPHPAERTELLHPEELSLLAAMRSDKRRQEFALGRIAVRRAFSGLRPDLELPSFGRHSTGAVDWPPGFCGSITHCRQYAAAVVAIRSTVSSIGIDLQEIAAFQGSEVALRIADSQERAWIEGSSDPLEALAAVFSAKESIYKALSSIVGPGLGFRDVSCQPLVLAEIGSTEVPTGVLRVRVRNSAVCERLREKFSRRDASTNAGVGCETAALELLVNVQLAHGYVLSGIAL